MKLPLLKQLSGCFLLISLSACQAQANPHHLLRYSSGNDAFVLERECVKAVSLIQPSDDRMAIDPLRLRFEIEKSPLCAGQFSRISTHNIGKQLIVSFNENVISQDKIVSPLRVESEFSQGVSDVNTAREILGSYQK